MMKPFKYLSGLVVTGLLITISCSVRAQQTPGENSIQSEKKIEPAVVQRLSFVTIGARDLNKLKQFYIEKFNWTPIKSNPGIVFFKMNGFMLALYPSADIAAGAGVANDGQGFKRFSFTINYPSEKEVEQVFKTLRGRGVNIVKSPQKASWGGYVGYVADAEDNLWEIAYNPFVELDKNGDVITHH